MIIYVKCPKEVWAHSGYLENVKSPTLAYLTLYCLMACDQLDHQRSDCSEIFWNNETFFVMFIILKSTVFLIKTVINAKWIFIFKRCMWVSLVREFSFKNPLMKATISMSYEYTKKLSELLLCYQILLSACIYNPNP